VIFTSVLICGAWGYMLYQNDVSSIWPMFGVANQLLATLALVIGTSYLLKTTRPLYSLITAIPAVFMAATTLTAGIYNLSGNYLPRGRAGDLNGYLNAFLTVEMMACVVIVATEGAWRFIKKGIRSGARPLGASPALHG
jgi:carbon starvation protein